MVFARGLNDHLARLAKDMDAAVKQTKNDSKSFFTFVSDDSELAGKLTDLAAKESLSIPLTIAPLDGGVKSLGVPDDAWVLAVAYRGKKAVETSHWSKEEFGAEAAAAVAALAKKQAGL